MVQIDEIRLELNKLKPKLISLGETLKITELEQKLKDLEIITAKSDFWSDTENSQKVLSEIKTINSKLKDYNYIKNSFEELEILLEICLENQDENSTDIIDLENNLKKFKIDLDNQVLSTLLTGEYDSQNAILTLHAGAGGTESQDWAEMLCRMYMRWAEKHKYKVKILDYLDGEEAGLKSASILIEGLNAYGFLKGENGVHRLVRISPFDASGRRHTSFASLEVIPEINDEIKIEISPDDIKMDVFRASGAGGQHVNKTSSAVRLTHIPTGIVVACQNERSQFQNRDTAMKILKSKLIEIKEREHLDKIDDIKGVQKEIAWGSQIRSYTFMPYTLVKDHRTGFEIGNVQAVMDGEIDGFINSYLTNSVNN
ncbi:MAG: peptide chain release factor 2 [Clostridia bacterium]|nr:peptide chain release factor 2 [Clostridia bacterium]